MGMPGEFRPEQNRQRHQNQAQGWNQQQNSYDGPRDHKDLRDKSQGSGIYGQ